MSVKAYDWEKVSLSAGTEIFTDYKMGYVINFNVPITEFYYGFINIIAFAFIMKFFFAISGGPFCARSKNKAMVI